MVMMVVVVVERGVRGREWEGSAETVITSARSDYVSKHTQRPSTVTADSSQAPVSYPTGQHRTRLEIGRNELEERAVIINKPRAGL